MIAKTRRPRKGERLEARFDPDLDEFQVYGVKAGRSRHLPGWTAMFQEHPDYARRLAIHQGAQVSSTLEFIQKVA